MAWIWSTNQKSKLFSCHHLPATHADRCEVPMWNSGLPCRDAEVLHSNCTHTENETASLFKGCSQYLSVQTIEKLLKRVGSMALETRASFIRTTVRKTEFEAPPSRSAAASSKAFSRSGWSSKDLGKTMQAACPILSNAATSSDDCNCLSETGNMGSPWLGRTWWTKSMCSAKPASWLKNEQIYLNSVQRLKTAETPQRSMEKYAVGTWCAKNQTQICIPEHPPRKEAAWLPSAKWQKRGKPVGPWKSAKLSCGKRAQTCYFRSPCESKGHVHLLEGWRQACEKEEGWIDPGMRTPTMNAMRKHYIDRLENSALKLRNLDGDRG